MNARRLALAIGLTLVVVIVQICAVNEIHLPLGVPDLPVLAVIGMALAWGPTWGASIGFATGLSLDLAPPADHAVGRLAIAYALVGYFVGLLEDSEEHSVPTTIFLVIAGAAGLVIVDLGLTATLGDGTVTANSALRLLVATVGYDVILAPFVVPLLVRISRRVEPLGLR